MSLKLGVIGSLVSQYQTIDVNTCYSLTSSNFKLILLLIIAGVASADALNIMMELSTTQVVIITVLTLNILNYISFYYYLKQ